MASPRWMHDNELQSCMGCNEAFSLIVRKHHCRKCGGLFCDNCSNTRLLVPRESIIKPLIPNPLYGSEDLSSVPQRCCANCAAELQKDQPELKNLLCRANKETLIERDALERYMNSPYGSSLGSEIRKACYTLFNFTEDNAIEGKDGVPRDLISNACGIAFFTIVKAGFFFTGKMGTGLVIRRLPDGSWSAPSAIAISGAGWGFQIGGEVTDMMIVLNTSKAVEVFTSRTQVSLGTALGVSFGPVGRSAGTDIHAGDTGVSAAFSYAHSKGLFVGVSLEAAVIASRPSVNRAFYGESVDPITLLSGEYPPPKGAEPLYKALSEIIDDRPTPDRNGTRGGDEGVERARPVSTGRERIGGSTGLFPNLSEDSWTKERLKRLRRRPSENIPSESNCNANGQPSNLHQLSELKDMSMSATMGDRVLSDFHQEMDDEDNRNESGNYDDFRV